MKYLVIRIKLLLEINFKKKISNSKNHELGETSKSEPF